MVSAEYIVKEPLLSDRMVLAAWHLWEGPSLPKDPEEASAGEAPLKKVSLEDIPLRQQVKAFQAEQSVCAKAGERKGEMSPGGGPRGEEEAGKAGWRQIVDALTCPAMNFILSVN